MSLTTLRRSIVHGRLQASGVEFPVNVPPTRVRRSEQTFLGIIRNRSPLSVWHAEHFENPDVLEAVLFDLSPDVLDALTFLLTTLDGLLSPTQLSAMAGESVLAVSLILYAVSVATREVRNSELSRPFPTDAHANPDTNDLWGYMRDHLRVMVDEYLALIELRTNGAVNAGRLKEIWESGAEPYEGEERPRIEQKPLLLWC
jgi:hypothetical protein